VKKLKQQSNTSETSTETLLQDQLNICCNKENCLLKHQIRASATNIRKLLKLPKNSNAYMLKQKDLLVKTANQNN
jgi:hypothetical protein